MVSRFHLIPDGVWRGPAAARLLLSGLLLAPAFEAGTLGASLPEVRLSTFSADVTVPVGHGMMGGAWRATRIADPLEAHGLVLLGRGRPVVFVAVDWCEIRNDALARWQTVLAAAAATDPERVMVSAVHQHDAPVADLEAERILRARKLGGTVCDLEFHEVAVQRVAQALRESLPKARQITHLGLGTAPVERIASNRRYLLADGSVRFDRTSSTRDPVARAAPENLVDPWLRTLSFWDGETPIAAVSAYAVHPMSYYGQGEVSADFPGLARRQRQQETLGVKQIYVSGASGNVTAGKYNDGAVTNRAALAARLHEAMLQAWNSTRRVPLTRMDFRVERVRLEPRNEPGFRVADLEQVLTPETKPFAQCLAAMGLSWRKRADAGHQIELPCLDFGVAQWVLLPGESYVEFQLAAQRMRPDCFVVVAGYGEGATGYIPTDRHIAEGDGNLHDWCWVAPGSELRLYEGIRRVLRASEAEAAAAPWLANLPIALVKTELYRRHSASRVAPWVSLQYVGRRFALREVWGVERESDVGEDIAARWSDDNGRTWSAFTPVQPSNKVRYGEVTVWEGESVSVYDPRSERVVQLWRRQIELQGVYHNFTYVRSSSDGGHRWSAPEQLRYEAGEGFDPDTPLRAAFLNRNEGYADGSSFYSPSSFHRMIRHSRTGKLYWLGNICATPPAGNSPRYPLVIAEVDEDRAALKRETVTALADRAPGQGDIQFSNFPLLEDRETHDLILHVTTYGQEPDPQDWATADNYRLTVALRP